MANYKWRLTPNLETELRSVAAGDYKQRYVQHKRCMDLDSACEYIQVLLNEIDILREERGLL